MKEEQDRCPAGHFLDVFLLLQQRAIILLHKFAERA